MPWPIDTASAPSASAFAASAPEADAAGDDELHDTGHVQVFERIGGLPYGRERRDAYMLDEGELRGRRAALHAIDHDHIRSGMHGQLHVVEGARGTHLHVDGFLPIGDLAQFADLDGKVIRPGPVGMP